MERSPRVFARVIPSVGLLLGLSFVASGCGSSDPTAPDGGDAFRILVFSRTTGFRHTSIERGQSLFRELAEAEGFGVDVTEPKTAYRARRMGFVFQFYNLLPVLSAVENVELPLLVSGTPRGEARERALASLARVGLAKRAVHRPAELSGGERQRVTIARALVNDPAIVWADEPTGDLDSQNADQVMSLMQQLNRDHDQTFVIVSHDRGVAERCHRIIHMQDGLIVREEVKIHEEGNVWAAAGGG